MIFKIAAVGILVTVLSQVLKHRDVGKNMLFDQSGGTYHRAVLDRALYIYELFETMQSLLRYRSYSVTIWQCEEKDMDIIKVGI